MEVTVQTPTRPAYEIAQFYGYLGGATGKDTRARYDSTVEHTHEILQNRQCIHQMAMCPRSGNMEYKQLHSQQDPQ